MSMTEMPDCIGPYRIVSKVGEGGMGVVYKAEDSRLGRVVALKIIRECDADFSRRRRFWQEARAGSGTDRAGNTIRARSIPQNWNRAPRPETREHYPFGWGNEAARFWHCQ